jgi:hypothetical protein
MTLNAGIILGGQTPDILGAMNQGLSMAQQQTALNRQNALAALYQEQGPGIMQGDANALAALAQLDPNAALGVQDARLGMDATRLGMDATRQDMAFSAEKMQMAREEGKRAAADAMAAQAANLTAEQIAAEKESITKGLSGASFFYQNKDKAGYEAFLTQNGMDPAEFPFEEFPAHAAMFEGAIEAMESFAPPAPAQSADRYKVVGGSLVDLEAQGGPAIVAEGSMQETMVMGPDGKPIMVQGGKGTAAKFTEGQSKDNVFATRATGALDKLESPAASGGTVADDLASLGDKVATNIPLVGNYITSEGYQTAETAGDEFLQAILRKDTGAAITPAEQSLYGKTYLPQPGDKPARLAYKKEARLRAVEAIKAGMNPAQIEAMARADAAVLAGVGDGVNPDQAASPKGKTVVDGYSIEAIE